jgi:hypothetical protein
MIGQPRTYIASRLLEHGPLTFREFQEITRWPVPACYSALRDLVATGRAYFNEGPGCRRRVYHLAQEAQ